MNKENEVYTGCLPCTGMDLVSRAEADTKIPAAPVKLPAGDQQISGGLIAEQQRRLRETERELGIEGLGLDLSDVKVLRARQLHAPDARIGIGSPFAAATDVIMEKIAAAKARAQVEAQTGSNKGPAERPSDPWESSALPGY